MQAGGKGQANSNHSRDAHLPSGLNVLTPRSYSDLVWYIEGRVGSEAKGKTSFAMSSAIGALEQGGEGSSGREEADVAIEEEGLEAKLDEEEDNESSELTASDNDESWISWFVNLRGHDFFCEVDEDYIQDDFNLTGLSGMVPYYDYALDLMLDVDSALDRLSDDQQEIVESAAIILYGLIHARFILTSRGMLRMVSGQVLRFLYSGRPY